MESHNVEYDSTSEIVEVRRSPLRKFSTLNGSRHGISSNTAVHELLECPICMNVMYPPIQQWFDYLTYMHLNERIRCEHGKRGTVLSRLVMDSNEADKFIQLVRGREGATAEGFTKAPWGKNVTCNFGVVLCDYT